MNTRERSFVADAAGHVGALVQHLFLNIERSRRVGAGEFFPATPYIFCLSGNEDYLYFWSEYMKDANGDASAGGFSVGLDHRRLQAAIKDANAASGGCRFLLLPCLYAGVDDARRRADGRDAHVLHAQPLSSSQDRRRVRRGRFAPYEFRRSDC